MRFRGEKSAMAKQYQIGICFAKDKKYAIEVLNGIPLI
jgi:hypothetical protein